MAAFSKFLLACVALFLATEGSAGTLRLHKGQKPWAIKTNAGGGDPPPAYIQSNSTNSGSVIRGVMQFPGSITAGSTVIIGSRQGGGISGLSSTITDNLGNTYVEAIKGFCGSDHTDFIAYCISHTGGTPFITNTFGNVNTMRWAMAEYSGLDAIGKTNSATSTGTSAASGDVTTEVAASLLFAMETTDAASTPTAGASFSIRQTVDTRISIADRVVSSTGTYGSTWTLGTSAVWDSLLVTFSQNAD